MDTPEISFCLPVYNSAERIERCLRAVLAQDVPSREILVVDNASTDDTVAKARALLAGVAEARIVVNERNLGRIENWNRCLELARGRYVRFALVNDVWLPGSAEMLLQAARAQPEAVMIYSRARIVQSDAAPETPAPPHPPVKTFTSAQIIEHWCNLGYNDTDNPNTVLLSREAINRAGLRFRADIPYCADFYFLIEVAGQGPVAGVQAESCLFYKGAPGRFANAGLRVKSYYAEARECSQLLGRLTAAHGRKAWQGFGFLYFQYKSHRVNFGDAPRPGYWATFRLFKDGGIYRAWALDECCAGRPWSGFHDWLRHIVIRVGVKCGLYHLSQVG